jgi:hypothetical protein
MDKAKNDGGYPGRSGQSHEKPACDNAACSQGLSVVTPITFQRQTQTRTEDDLLGHLREQAHQAGIFVLLEGDLGSYHSKISPEEFRGIAIADSVVPLIVINPNDAKSARVFTLVHELAHI